MAIIIHVKEENIKFDYLNIFPDQFKTEAQKQKPSYIKTTMDYFATRAYSEYKKNVDTIVPNYDLVKGILRREDFFQEPEVKSFTDIITAELELPSYVKHYSIITTPLNELIGEISKRPDTYKVKAFDDDSKSEELQYKTEILNQYILGNAKAKILQKLAMQGEEVDEDELTEMAFESVKDQLDSYTSIAEKWGNHILTAAKAEFNTKEKSEDAFRDLGIAAQEYIHLYEDNSKTGYNIEVENPKYVWKLTTPDKKYTSDPSGRNQGAYAAGTVKVMDISEIIETIPDITKEEIDHLRTSLQDYGLVNVRESNLGRDVTPGIGSIKYDVYDPLVMQERMILESEMKENKDELRDWLGLTNNVSSFGYKYVVVRAYWVSKKKIGKLIYEDELGNIQSILVDENYKSGTIPTQISLEWGWINQWYQGLKIGPDIYHMKPLKILDYCPIIGTTFEIKNTEARSIIDMMKPFQVLYNICMNQLYKLLEKEIGNVASINIRRIPKIKDGDEQDAIDIWEMEARERGIVFDDDSPENTKAPVTNTSVAKSLDLTRSNEIQSRYNLAVALKNECWELVGMSKQRLGSISASESATGVNSAIQQSYSQTEPLFIAHEYVWGQVYQAILDASQYIESAKPESTLSYVTNEGEAAFIKVNGNDLKLRHLKVFPTNRPEDTQMFNDIRALSQAILQNGGSVYDIIELYSTQSLRQMKKTFKDLHDRNLSMIEEQNQIKRQELEQQARIAQAEIDEARAEKAQDRADENYNKELDRINKLQVAALQASSRRDLPDTDNNNVPDLLEGQKATNDRMKALNDYNSKMAQVAAQTDKINKDYEVAKEKLSNERANMQNDKEVAKINASNRNKQTSKKK